MSGRTFLVVALACAGMLLAFQPHRTDVPQIIIPYPEPTTAPAEVISSLPYALPNVISAKIDPISQKIALLVCSPLATGVNATNESDAVRAAETFVQKFKLLFGVDEKNLVVQRAEKIKNNWYVTFRQRKGNLNVIGAVVELRINPNGEIFLLRSSIKPMTNDIDLTPDISRVDAISSVLDYVGASDGNVQEARLAVAPMPKKEHYEGRLVWWVKIHTKQPLGTWLVWIDAHSGEMIYARNILCTVTGNIAGEYKPNYIDEESDTGALPYMHIAVDGDHDYTDSNGDFNAGSTGSGSHSFYAELNGHYCSISDGSYPRSEYNASFSGTTFDFVWTTADARENQLNLYYHTNWIHDYVKNFLGYSGMDYSMPAQVNDPAIEDNAYWDGEGINFGTSGGMLYDLAMFSDVIYHEYTHGVTHHIYPWDGLISDQGRAIDEGLADYFPCSIHDDSRMGERAFIGSPTEFMRNLSNANRYPDDFVGESHYDSQIISGAWWEIRSALGENYTDSLVHLSRFGHPEYFEDFLYEMLAVDDDDGNLDNGTPNCGVIYTAYHNHGIGPDEFLSITHIPLHDTEDTLGTYPVVASINALLGVDSVSLCYRVNYSSWVCVPLDSVGGELEGEIPAQSLGSMIHYYIYARDIADNETTSPEGAPIFFHSFNVIVDTIPPVITHIPLLRGCYNAWSPVVAAQISDDVGIASAIIEYTINGASMPNEEMEYDISRDCWIGYFGNEIEPDDEIAYRIIAVDNSSAAHTTTFPSDDSWLTFTVVTDYTEDVETGGYDYSHYSIRSGYLDEWHIETVRKHSGDYSFKCGGTGTFTYSDKVDAALETPEIAISYNDTLSFFHWAEIETSDAYYGYAWDGGIVEMSTDGGASWTQITPLEGYPFRIRSNPASPFDAETPCFSGRRNWQQIHFRLTHNGSARFRFHFGSDAYVVGEGWYLDDIHITNISGTSVFNGKAWQPQKLSLSASPNPFNSATRISIAIPSDARIDVNVLDISGRVIKNLLSTNARAGTINLIWQPDGIPSGVYFIRATSSSAVADVRMLLLK